MPQVFSLIIFRINKLHWIFDIKIFFHKYKSNVRELRINYKPVFDENEHKF